MKPKILENYPITIFAVAQSLACHLSNLTFHLEITGIQRNGFQRGMNDQRVSFVKRVKVKDDCRHQMEVKKWTVFTLSSATRLINSVSFLVAIQQWKSSDRSTITSPEWNRFRRGNNASPDFRNPPIYLIVACLKFER